MTAKKKLFIPAGWLALEAGVYGAEMVKAGGRWYKREDDVPGRVFGRACAGIRYRHREYTEHGVLEDQICVADDGTWKGD